jgi:hypothetical protein
MPQIQMERNEFLRINRGVTFCTKRAKFTNLSTAPLDMFIATLLF